MAITRLATWDAETTDTPEALVAGYNSISTTYYHSGLASYRFIGTSQGFRMYTSTLQMRAHYWILSDGLSRAAGSSYTLTRPVYFGFYPDPVATETYAHGVLYNSVTERIEMYVLGSLVDAVDAAQTGLYNLTTWHSMGVNIKSDASAGWFSFYLDGIQILNYTGAIVSWQGFGIFNRVSGIYSSHTAYIDGIIIESTFGEPADEAVLQKKLFTVYPNGVGVDSDWTPFSGGNNYEEVDEVVSDDDTTYNLALSAGLKDTFTFGDVSEISGWNLSQVTLQLVARWAQASPTVKLHAWDGSTYNSSSDQTLALAYTTVLFVLSTQNDSSDWNVTDFNTYQFGYESSGSF